MRRRTHLLTVAMIALLFLLVPGVAVLATEPDGHWIAEDIDSAPGLPSIVHVSIGDTSRPDGMVRIWLRDNRATVACAASQGPGFSAAIAAYVDATGDFIGPSMVWCPSEASDTNIPLSFNYDEAKDELTDVLTYRRVEEPVYVGLVDPGQGLWYLRDGAGSVKQFFYGNPGDFPILGDWDCNGVDTPGMYRQSDGFVYLRNSNTQGNADLKFFFGNPGDIPIVGDFNKDRCDTVSIYRPSQGRVFIINALGDDEGGLGDADLDYYFGNPGDKPFIGDFDGDGTDTVGLHRESTGLVYFRNSHTQGNADDQFIYGNPGDRLVAADWIDDGIDSPTIFRPSSSTFFFRFTNTQGVANDVLPWGSPSWLPVAGHFGSLSAPLCDLSYPTECFPPAPPDIACTDITEQNFIALLPDLHVFDGDRDGVGCES